MKKFIAICAVLLFVAPAFAADWAFYGSRASAPGMSTGITATAQCNGQDDDQATQWALQGNSRLGAKVKADKVSGQVELGLSPPTAATAGTAVSAPGASTARGSSRTTPF